MADYAPGLTPVGMREHPGGVLVRQGNVLVLEAPVFHAYARDDPLIQPERFEELEALLARSPRRAGPRLCWPEGGHYVQKTHAAELSEALNAWVQTEL